MRDYRFALTANAGLSITLPDAVCMVDALHAIKAPMYSSVTPDMWEQIQKDPDYAGKNLKGPDAIAFSHCHIDHFSSDIMRDAMKIWPDTAVILPEKYFDKEIYVHGQEMFVDVNGISLHFIRTHHSTHRHHHKTHYSLLINDAGHTIFMPVDSSMSDPDMLAAAEQTDVDIAVVDFIWVLLDKGRELIQNVIRPKHLLIYHLQFEKDDYWDYRRQTHEAVQLLPDIPDIRIFDTPFQKEDIRLD